MTPSLNMRRRLTDPGAGALGNDTAHEVDDKRHAGEKTSGE
jgi:hypothetical protein